PLWADYKPHWSGAAAIFLCIGAGALWSQGLVWKTRVWIKPFSKTILGGLLAFLIPLNIFIYTPFLGPWMPKVFHFFAPNKQWQTTYDLSNEFHGWKDLGSYLNRRQREIHAESGKKPFFAAHRYENTAQTYWGSLQKVYMLNTTVSHYTVMQKFSGVIENLKGQDCLFVTTEKYPANPLDFASFDDCKPETLNTYRDQELSRQFVVYYCKNFQGIK
ncbi:MAG: hypothetical protein ACOYOK_07910, partial [Pseudobdellovibrionaceae bacterium]